MADQPVGDVAGHPAHPLLHGGGVDRNPIANRLVRADPALDVDVLIFAGVANWLAARRFLHDQANRLDRLAKMRGRLAVFDRMPRLVEPLDAGAEAETESSPRHLVDVERGDGEDEGAAGEGPGDSRRYSDPLGSRRQPGCLRDGAAKELRGPDAVDAGGLRDARLLGEVLDRVADRGDRDAVEGSHGSDPSPRIPRPACCRASATDRDRRASDADATARRS